VFFNRHSLQNLTEEIEKLFSEGIRFAKTVDRKVLGHMNDFVRCSQPLSSDTNPFDCELESEHINNMPINAGSINATRPIDKFNELLGIELPKKTY